jgi:hypothetical protein
MNYLDVVADNGRSVAILELLHPPQPPIHLGQVNFVAQYATLSGLVVSTMPSLGEGFQIW